MVLMSMSVIGSFHIRELWFTLRGISGNRILPMTERNPFLQKKEKKKFINNNLVLSFAHRQYSDIFSLSNLFYGGLKKQTETKL